MADVVDQPKNLGCNNTHLLPPLKRAHIVAMELATLLLHFHLSDS